METTQTTSEHALEIACDESGWEGSNLVTGNSDVIAHASIRLPIDEAAECIRVLRGRPDRHSYEFKASHLIRAKGAANLLGPDGPVFGRATVHLTHKSCFVLGRILDMFIGNWADVATVGLRPEKRVAELAASLCRAGPVTFGQESWLAFMVAANVVLRADRRGLVREPVDGFFGQVGLLRTRGGSGMLDELGDVTREAYSARKRLLDEHMLHPVLEPLIPALARTVLYWSHGVRPVAVIHDEQSALTERRMRRLEQILAAPPLELIRLPDRGRFLHFRQVDSRTDSRVQVADLLAGVARKVAADELLGRHDPDLTALLRPYVDPASRWCRQLADPSG